MISGNIIIRIDSNMPETKTYDNYPYRIVMVTNLVPVLTYLAGLLIMISFSLLAAVLYLIYILVLEVRLLSRHCVNCYYWGKRCAFGKGKISSLLFKKGDMEKFCEGTFGWKDMIPDILVFLIPLITGVILLITRFDLFILATAIILIALNTAGNAYIRGNLACRYCKQRETGCPAEQLFSKRNT